MIENYNFRDIEEKWQKKWEEEGMYQAESKSTKKKYYCLVEFPYPSGEGLHTGHPRSYTAMDIIARKRRAEGYNVLYPIGWDAFGLPAENYAIKTGVHPSITTKKNADNFRRQFKRLGFSFDWSREIDTTNPEYYKWTQWMFLQFVKHDMAYKAKVAINWCPKDKTGLANEEVVNGCCERCGTPVEKREKEQWMIRITKYADRLLEGLDWVDYLPQIKQQQKNWIGRSEGASIQFAVIPAKAGIQSGSPIKSGMTIEVFTTRPDTIFGATYMVLAPEHSLVTQLVGSGLVPDRGGAQCPALQNVDEVRKYVEQARNKSDIERTELQKEKTGVELKGVNAINPANGEDIPVWVADYVLGGYGTGAIMAVPAHDERDFEFAKKFGLPIRQVATSPDNPPSPPYQGGEGAVFSGNGIVINSDFLNDLSTEEAKEKITQWLEKEGKGKKTVQYKLRDWVFSRQRYWGEPIPMIHCEKCARQKQKVLILHGFEGGAEGNWMPWMKRELEARGFEVRVPQMSDANHPDLKTWMKELEPLVQDFGEQDIVIGHSLGSKAALHLLEKSKIHIQQLYLIASAIGEIDQRQWDWFRAEWGESDIDSLKRFWEARVDFKKVTKKADGVTVILSNDDPFIPLRTHENIPSEWNFQVWKGFEHFQEKEIPKLLEEVLKSKNTGWIPVPEKDLPVELPKVEKYQPTDNGESPLASVAEWVNVECPKCGGAAKRETDTMPNWAGSSWYFLRYCDPENKKEFASKESLLYWMGVSHSVIPAKAGIQNTGSPIAVGDDKKSGGVDWYNGGMEHTVLHLLYSRFWYKFLYDIGVIPKECGDEPYQKRTSHGLILGEGGEKMSKSRGNVVNPDDVVEKFGADAFRLYEMFMGPFDQPIPWDTNGIVGCERFLGKVWKAAGKVSDQKNEGMERLTHKTLKKVSEDVEAMRFNTAVSAMMILVNEMEKAESVAADDYHILLRMLSPFAPHITEELNEQGCQMSGARCQMLATQPWPKWNSDLVKDDEVDLVVQVNGKMRDTVRVAVDIDEAGARAAALASEKVQKFLAGKEMERVIFVKGRLINLIV